MADALVSGEGAVMNVMFDSNAYDKVLASKEDLERIVACKKHKFYITDVQKMEIANIPNAKKRSEIEEIYDLIHVELLYVPAIVGYAKIGTCIVAGKDDRYNKLVKPSRVNVADAIIGSTAASKDSMVVVTNDAGFLKQLSSMSIPVMNYEAFRLCL